MPSLRRTFSAPARSSPYSSSTQTRTGSRSPRRSSGSETANRRVLADIDWWRVEEGQRQVRGLSPHDQLRPATPASDEEEVDQEERDPSPVAPTPSHNTGFNIDLPLWHNVPGAGWDTFDGFELSSSDLGSADPSEYPQQIPSTLQQFAALSLNPIGRASLHRTMSSSSAFSDMSFSSDSSFSTPTPSPTGLSMGFEDFGSPPADNSDDETYLPYASLSLSSRRPSVAPTRSARSASYSDVESELSFSRDLFSYFDDDEESSFSGSSTSNEDVFF
ncbi:hypothetical protein BC835DRAFT_1409925 [Cytidiella melzeri]|nr:hypothetical protein BC835DRAFT_1409925 [Cytidiella melzeri]